MITLDYLATFDLETTGVSVTDDRIVTSSIVYMGPGDQIIAEYEWLVNPGIEIPEAAANVHGVTTEMARERGEGPITAVYEIAGVLAHFLSVGVPVVAYNAAYDFSLLDAEIRRHLDYSGLADFFESKQVPKAIIDPFVLDKQMSHRPGSRKLIDTSSHYGVSLENAHTSKADCLAAGLVTRALFETYPGLQEATLEDLYNAQQEWYAQQKTSLKAYFEKINKPFSDFNTEWPIREAVA